MEPAIAGKIVERKLTRIITPGTRLAENQIEANRNQFLLALEFTKTQTHLLGSTSLQAHFPSPR